MTAVKCPGNGKVSHTDRAGARRVQETLPYRDKVESYPCTDCGGWHLGGHHRRHRGDDLAQIGRKRHAQRK